MKFTNALHNKYLSSSLSVKTLPCLIKICYMHIAIKSHVRRPQYELQYNYMFESYLDPRLTFAIRGNDENSAKFLRRLSAIVLRTFMGSPPCLTRWKNRITQSCARHRRNAFTSKVMNDQDNEK